MDDAHLHRLESVAQQLVARIRDEDPERILVWLRDQLDIDPRLPVSDLERLVFVMAAAIPTDLPWSRLIAWTEPFRTPIDAGKRARMRRVA